MTTLLYEARVPNPTLEQHKKDIVDRLIEKLKAEQAIEKEDYEYKRDYDSNPDEAFYWSTKIDQADFIEGRHPVDLRIHHTAEFIRALPSCFLLSSNRNERCFCPCGGKMANGRWRMPYGFILLRRGRIRGSLELGETPSCPS
jgi:hypothetical protein